MIKPSVLVQYMRDNRTSKTWQVDYATTYVASTDRSRLPMPAFYADVNSTSVTTESDGEYLQLFTTNIRVRLVCLSTADRLGRTGSEIAYYARQELFKILLFKKIDPRFNEIYFLRDDFETYDEARYIHTFDFAFTGVLDPDNLEIENFSDLKSIIVDYNLTESPSSEHPNATDILNTFQD